MKYFTLFFAFTFVQSAPLEEKPQAIFDQKQTGEHNIQVHLKDLQIIAIVGDEVLGDYDYNYDYSDFTVKPPANVTLKPFPDESSSVSTNNPENTSDRPDNLTKPILPSSSQKPESSSTSLVEKRTEKGDSTPVSTSSPDKIKVQIIEEPNPNIAIVPSDDMGVVSTPTLGEVVHYRRCATGFARDKRGRCRRVRRPGHQHQFNIGRLASDLVARLGGSTGDNEDAKEGHKSVAFIK